MTRISETQLSRTILTDLARNRSDVARYSEQISTGLLVVNPGDSVYAGTISQLNGVVERVDGFSKRISTVESHLLFQNEALVQAQDIMVRAKEIAIQAGNEVNSETERYSLAEEVLQLRDHMVSLANSQFQGSYIFAGAADGVPPYSAATYTNGEGLALDRYEYTTADGSDVSKTVRVTDNLTLRLDTPGNQIFDNSIRALERLGRALKGYRTEPATGAPDGTGDPYNFPDDYDLQSEDIRETIDLVETARTSDLSPEAVNIAGRLTRLETARSLLDLSNMSNKEVLSHLRDADVIESATNLSLAETALQASMAVASKMLNLTILNYL